MTTPEIAKFNMIKQQIRPWEVLDNRVLSVLEQVSREDFVPEPYKGLAYADCQIPLAAGVRMLPPTVEGRMLQSLVIDPADEILEIGSGSGYITACLAKLARRVTSIDSRAEIIEYARENVSRFGATNVAFEQRGLAQVSEDQAYDAITVNGSLESLPDNLKLALKTGGRLFAVIGDSPVMEAMLITRVSAAEWSQQSLFETDLPRLAD